MEWKKEWMGKRIFVKLRTGDIYTGEVIDVDESAHPIVFITIIDKYNTKVTIVTSEIIKLAEQR